MTAILDTGFIFALTDKTDDNHAHVLRVAQIMILFLITYFINFFCFLFIFIT